MVFRIIGRKRGRRVVKYVPVTGGAATALSFFTKLKVIVLYRLFIFIIKSDTLLASDAYNNEVLSRAVIHKLGPRSLSAHKHRYYIW